MLRTNDKKINTAFGRLRERRIDAGLETTAEYETQEQEEQRINQSVKAAQATGDIATIISIIVNSSKRTPTDVIHATCGGLLFMYYAYMDKLHCRPVDIEDMITGLLYLDAKNYLVEDNIDKMRQGQRKK